MSKIEVINPIAASPLRNIALPIANTGSFAAGPVGKGGRDGVGAGVG